MAADAMLVMAALLAGTWTWVRSSEGTADAADQLILFGLATLPVWVAVFHWQRLYSNRDDSRFIPDVRRVVNATALGSVSFILLAWPIGLDVPRVMVAVAFVALVPAMLAERQIVRMIVRRRRREGVGLRPVAILGANAEAIELAEVLVDPTLGRRVVGFISTAENVPEVLCGVEVHHSDDPARTAAALGVDKVVIAATALEGSASTGLLRSFLDRGIQIEMTSALTGVANNRIHVRAVGPHPMIMVDPGFRGGWRATAKRAFDIVVSGVALLLTWPILAVAAIAVKLETPGPVFFSQDRLGHRGRPFKVHKIRTMVDGAESMRDELEESNDCDGPLFKMSDDPRVTRVGRLLRRTSLDELPQLWNVIKGEMSLVGPRPALPEESEAWSDELRNRLRVRPGLTGMWQTNGRSETSFSEYQRLDLFYIDNWSILTDIGIILRTIPAVVRRRGAA